MNNKTHPWLPSHSQTYINDLEAHFAAASHSELEQTIHNLVTENDHIHNRQSINLNPATNTMNPRAEKVMGSGLGPRPSLGYPGDKYEMGLEAIEKIEVLADQLVRQVFNAQYAETRLASGSLANLYSFMATTQPGDNIIVPPPAIGGHVTHHTAGAAGLYGLNIHFAPIDPHLYTVNIEALRELAQKVQPKLMTIGGSLNLHPHPVRQMRQIADEVGAYLHFDAAHLSGMIAGHAWPQPLEEGAHIMSFSTYKSLGGPPAGVVVTNELKLAQRLDKIAFPGLTANFDVAKTAALGITMLDWLAHGRDYAQEMGRSAATLASELQTHGIPVYTVQDTPTRSHQFAINATPYGGGQTLAKKLRRANLLTCGIGLPTPEVTGDLNGLRIGTPEVVRWGMTTAIMPEIATFFKRVLIDQESPEQVGQDVTEFRQQFTILHYIRP